MEYEPTIGIETHAQLLIASKMFCSCSAEYAAAAPNSLVCPVCLGLPGSLPVINRCAVEFALMAGLALNCDVAEFSKFDRKNYNYPDLVKGYQISQYDLPLCRNGWMDIQIGAGTKRIGIQRVHLEEDTGKLVHVQGQSLIDFNRSGVPLMEIVTGPDFESVEEVRAYAQKLHTSLKYLGVNSGNMEEGALRFEANVSIHPAGTPTKGNLVELKNLNSFRALWRSVEYEIKRQKELVLGGGVVRRETRGWDDVQGVTFVQRSKEYADDYRYFPEPDLPPLEVPSAWVDDLRAKLPELPDARSRRFATEYSLGPYDTGLLTDERAVGDYFEQAVAAGSAEDIAPKAIANWMITDLFHLLNTAHTEIKDTKVTPAQLAELIALVCRDVVNTTIGRHVLQVMFDTGRSASEIVMQEGLAGTADADGLASVVDQVICDNPTAVAQYRGGKEAVLRFLVGQVMRASSGKADAKLAAEALKRKLSA
jgi:aspartyl-tRNA(Asn)/glutamyl-tRNA(Gln) amidotransferase subunit B